MPKTTIAITIDSEVIESVRAMKVNISKEVNEYFKSWLIAQQNDPEGMDVRLTQMQLEKNIKKLNHYQSAVKACQAKIERFEERQKADAEEKLKKEKEAIELLSRCISCGTVIAEGLKKHAFDKGMVCNPCYRTSTADKVKEWMSNG